MLDDFQCWIFYSQATTEIELLDDEDDGILWLKFTQFTAFA